MKLQIVHGYYMDKDRKYHDLRKDLMKKVFNGFAAVKKALKEGEWVVVKGDEGYKEVLRNTDGRAWVQKTWCKKY